VKLFFEGFHPQTSSGLKPESPPNLEVWIQNGRMKARLRMENGRDPDGAEWLEIHGADPKHWNRDTSENGKRPTTTPPLMFLEPVSL